MAYLMRGRPARLSVHLPDATVAALARFFEMERSTE